MKLIYIDTETTGLDAIKNGMTEIACIVVVDGEIVDKQLLQINPFTYNKPCHIEMQALEVTNKTLEDIESYPKSETQFTKFIDLLERHIDKFDKGDKFQIVGYNIGFDIPFLQNWFKDNQCHFYGAYFSYKDIDVFALVKHLKLLNMFETDNDKLETVCNFYGIKIDAHQALSDIEATRQLYINLVDIFFNAKGIEVL